MACFGGDRVADPSGRFDADDALEAGPGVVGVDVGEVGRVTDGAAAAVLDAAVARVDGRAGREVSEQQGCAVGLVRLDERVYDPRVELLMVVLEGQHVVGALFDDLGRDRGLAAHRVDRDDRSFVAEQLQ